MLIIFALSLSNLLNISFANSLDNKDRFNNLIESSRLLLYSDQSRTLKANEELSNIENNWNSTPLNLNASIQHIEVVNNNLTPTKRSNITTTSTLNSRRNVLENISYKRLKQNTEHDIAVIIANKNYTSGKNIPDNDPAIQDGKAFEKFATDGLGVKSGNIIWLKNASQAHLLRVFGSTEQYKGQLFDWVKKDRSRVYVYYAGHGAPSNDNDSFLVPVDSDGSRLDLNGYKIRTLYKNLSKIPSKSTLVILESCFSGISQSGNIITNASPIYAQASSITPPKGITVISAAKHNQIASWEPDGEQSLFTEYFLKGMSGVADTKPYGNNDNNIDWGELDKYLKDNLTYWARRYYGRDQTAEIFNSAQ